MFHINNRKMPKTKEEILADIAKAVEGQGNQGAIAIAPILKDIVELAGEGGGGTELSYELVSITINTGPYGYIDWQDGAVVITAADAAKLKAALDAGKLCMVAVNMNVDQSESTAWPQWLATPAFVQARKKFSCPDAGGDIEEYDYGIYMSGATLLSDHSTNNCIFVVADLDTTSPQMYTLEGTI